MTSLAKYSFLPWLKQGISNKIAEQDNLGADIPADSTMAKERAELNVRFRLNNTLIDKNIKLQGPGDVIGISRDAVLRVHPKEGTENFESNALAYIEFYEEDFPWRYTPAVRVQGEKRLRPWLFLIVAKEGEYLFRDTGNGIPYVSIKNEAAHKVFPNHRETWAWAHVHFNHHLDANDINNSVAGEIKTNPDVAYSRLICPRRLERAEEGVKYHAFLIPAFETGRLAGLGEDPKDVFAQAPSWTTGNTASSTVRPNDYPVYYHWEFKTDKEGDFESLVRILKAHPLGPRFGKRDMNILKTGMGLDDVASTHVLGLEGALKPPSFSPDTWPGGNGDVSYRNKLKNLLNVSQELSDTPNSNAVNPFYVPGDPNVFYSEKVVDDPIVSPPIYGKWHALVKKVGENGSSKKWVDDLNLNPKNRAAASVGSKVVKQQQEKFMETAWNQVGQINEANQKIREAELAKMVNNAIYEKHFIRMDKDKLLMVTSAAHKFVLNPETEKTFEENLTQSKVPNAARSAAFKRIIRPGKKAIKKLNKTGEALNNVPVYKNLITNFNLADTDTEERALTAAKKKIEPEMVVSTEEVERAINYFLELQDSPEASDDETLVLDPEAISSQEAFYDNFTSFATQISSLSVLPTPPPLQDMEGFTRVLAEQIDPLVTIPGMLAPRILIGAHKVEKVKPVMAYPVIPDPMFRYLKKISQDLIIPNIVEIPENTITLLENNQVFIESFMAGLNHEMSKELLWREYPTDQRGSYFRNFWDDKDSLSVADDHDILPMDRWNDSLGEHNEKIINENGTPEKKKNFVVLVIRGNLLRKYPNTVIYANKAVSRGAGKPRGLADAANQDNIRTPIFQAELDPDIALFGFNLTKEEAMGNGDYPEGWFFVLKERPGQINFGLDDSDTIPAGSAGSWNDLEWGHLVPPSGSLDNLFYIPCTPIRATASNPSWGTNSAEMAFILYQNPVLFARHASEMLP